MLTVPALDRTTVAPPAPPDVAIAPAWAPVVLTPRGTAAARLSDFQDAWAELTTEDRRWFAEWLRDLLIDAVEEGVPA